MKPPRLLDIRTAVVSAPISALGFGVAALGAQGVYEVLIVPLLPSFRSIPPALGALVLLPNLVAVLAVAWMIRGWVVFGVSTVSGGLADHALRTWFAHTGRPGHLKSAALEVPEDWWTTELGTSCLRAACWLAVACAAVALVRRIHERHVPTAERPMR